MPEAITVSELLALGERVLEDSTHIFEGHDLEGETRALLGLALGIPEVEVKPDVSVPRRARERYLSAIARRAGGEPFPHLTGFIDFCNIRLEVKPGAFVPRPSSELTVEWAGRHLKKVDAPIVLDVCTGAGPIALALAKAFPEAQVWGADISGESLRQARHNARRLGLGNVTFKRGDMYEPIPPRLGGKVDLITAHVPYVALGELDDLPTEVRDYEPSFTLSDSSEDGMFLMRRAIEEAIEWLRPGGWLLLETAEDLASEVEDLLLENPFHQVGVVSDDDRLSVVVEGKMRSRPGRPR